MKNLIKTIQNYSFQNNLWKRGDKIVIGVSGGPDSVCLLDIFAQLAPKYDLELIIAHVNYGLRGKDSERDEKFVKELGKRYEIEVKTLSHLSPSLSLKKAREDKEFPSENELRNIRYAFFEKIRKEKGFDLIAVAHQQDDQAETVLLRLLRGAGLKGLSGMLPQNARIIRPLLNTSREEILEYLKKNNFTYRTDRTNRTNYFSRNKIRNQLLPLLGKEFNSNIKKTLAESAAVMANDYLFLNQAAKKYFARGYHSSVNKLLSLDPAIQKRVLLLAIAEKKGGLEDVESKHIQEIIKALKSTKGKHQIVLFGGLKLTRKGDRVILS